MVDGGVISCWEGVRGVAGGGVVMSGRRAGVLEKAGEC